MEWLEEKRREHIQIYIKDSNSVEVFSKPTLAKYFLDQFSTSAAANNISVNDMRLGEGWIKKKRTIKELLEIYEDLDMLTDMPELIFGKTYTNY